ETTWWNRALAAGEITAIFGAGNPAPPPPPPPPPPPTTKPILYFVPGIAGSELKERTVGAGDFSIWPDAIVFSHLGPLPAFDLVAGLSVMDDGETSVYDVYASKVQDTAFGSDVYGIALDELQMLVDEGIVGELDK